MNEHDQYLTELVKKFELSIKSNQQIFFDADELEEIIEYYFTMFKMDRVKIAIDLALNQYPYSVIFRIFKAQFLSGLHKTKEALDILSELEKIEPSNSEIYTTRAVIYGQMGLSEQAIENYKIALSYSDDPAEIYIAIGQEFLNEEKADDAIYFFKKAIKIKKEADYLLNELALSFDLAVKNDDALKFFTEYIDEFPFSYQAWFNLGICHSKKQNYEKAIEAYDYCIAINENFSSAYFNKGNSLANLNRFEEAIDVYKETFTHEKPDPTAYYYIGECYEQLEKFDQALLNFNKAVKLDSNFADAWLAIGIVLEAQNRITEGIHYVKKAIEINSANSEYWYVFAEIQTKLGFFEEAMNAYGRVLELGYDDFDVYLDFSSLLIENGMEEDSVQLLKEGIKFFPECAELHYRLSAHLMLQNKKQDALTHLQQALSIDYEKHNELFDFIPDLKENATVIQVINTYKKTN